MAKTLETIRKLFPEVAQISDNELREKVLKIWLETWKASHYDQIDQIPFIRGKLPEINLVNHTRTVTKLCIQFAKMIGKDLDIQINMDYLTAGSLLHDVGKVFEYSEPPTQLGRLFTHAISAVYIASRENLPLEVIHIIGMHTREGDLINRTIEATILHSVDFAYAEVAFMSKAGIGLAEWLRSHEFRNVFAKE